MWNRRAVPRRPSWFLYVSVRIDGEKQFAFSWPVALPVLLMLADALDDLLLFPRIWSARRRKEIGWITSADFGLKVLRGLTAGLMSAGPTDLADIDLREDKSRISVKCLLR